MMADYLRKSGRKKILRLLLMLLSYGLLNQLHAQQLASYNPIPHRDGGALQAEKLSLKQFLGKLESHYHIKFAFDNQLVEDKYVTTKAIDQQELQQILLDVLAPLNLQYKKLTDQHYVIKKIEEDTHKAFPKIEKKSLESVSGSLSQFIVPQIGMRQTKLEKTITGKVTDTETGEALPGVNILAKGTSSGTVTGIDGDYRLTVADEVETLIFSSIGYLSQEVAINNQSEINVSLDADVQALEEIVVVGYGTQEKKDLTGAIASVSGEKIAERGTVSPLQAVQGQIAGVDISAGSGRAGANFNIQIRGQNTLSDESGPLYVVDGVIVDNIRFLNPQDIASLDVLKDASSTAVFGSRGSNGVVIITTKQGSKQDRATISYDGYFGIRQNARQPDFMTGDEWWEYRQNTYISPALIQGDDYDANIGGLEGSEVLAQRLANKEFTYWPDYFLQTGLQQNHWLSISGSSGKMNYVLGAGYQEEKGNLVKDWFNRYNFKANINHELNDKWKAGASFNFSLSETERGSPRAVINAYRMSPLVTPYDSLGEPLYQPAKYAGISFTSSVSPLFESEYSEDNTREIFGVGNLYLEYSPIDWIDIRSTFAPRVSTARQGLYWGSQTETRSLADPAARRNNEEIFSYNWDNQINISKKFGNHSLNALALYSLWYLRQENSFIDVENLPFESLYYNVGSAPDIRAVGSSFGLTTLTSFMGRINYTYQEKYLLTLSTRWDGSSKLAPGYKWSAFPSAAVGWRISEENFLQDVRLIDNLKLRLSYGFTGNNNIDPYATQVLANAQTYYDFGGSLAKGFAPTGIVNPALTWEKTREVNFGIDYGLFEGRVSGTIDLYDKLSKSLLLERRLPLETGWGPLIDNIGSVSNKGVELSLQTVNISTENLRWSTSFTFARNKNAIVELLNGKEDLEGNRWFIGEPINVNYTYVFDGIWQEDQATEAATYGQLPGQARVEDLSGPEGVPDGSITTDDYTIIGSPIPDWTGGFSTQINYKGLDFSLSLFTRQGVQVESPFHSEFLNYKDRGRAKLMTNYYMPANEVTQARASNSFPQPNNVGNYWDPVKAFQDASFVKVQNIQLGYSLPLALLERANIQRARFYVNVLNPFVFTDYTGFDPEWASEGLESTGNSFINYQFGVNVTF